MRIDDVCEVKEDNKQLQSVDKAVIFVGLTTYVSRNSCKQCIHKKEKDEER